MKVKNLKNLMWCFVCLSISTFFPAELIAGNRNTGVESSLATNMYKADDFGLNASSLNIIYVDGVNGSDTCPIVGRIPAHVYSSACHTSGS